MFCKKCGAQMEDNAVFCPKCGCSVNGADYQAQQPQQQNYANNTQAANPQDARSGGFAFLCFLFPIVGLILYLVWKDSLPQKAHSCGVGAIVGVCVYVGSGIIGGIIIAVASASFLAAYTGVALPLILL